MVGSLIVLLDIDVRNIALLDHDSFNLEVLSWLISLYKDESLVSTISNR